MTPLFLMKKFCDPQLFHGPPNSEENDSPLTYVWENDNTNLPACISTCVTAKNLHTPYMSSTADNGIKTGASWYQGSVITDLSRTIIEPGNSQVGHTTSVQRNKFRQNMETWTQPMRTHNSTQAPDPGSYARSIQSEYHLLTNKQSGTLAWITDAVLLRKALFCFVWNLFFQ